MTGTPVSWAAPYADNNLIQKKIFVFMLCKGYQDIILDQHLYSAFGGYYNVYRSGCHLSCTKETSVVSAIYRAKTPRQNMFI